MILEKKLKEVLMKAIETLGWRLAEPTFTLPKQKEHGDLATNIAFILAKQVGKPPIAVAQELVARIQPSPSFLKKIDVANTGFINFHIHNNTYLQLLSTIFKQGKKFGSQQLGKGTKVILEFVSANPTGPLNVVSARAAAVGDTLANILEKVGYKVHREYYVNDVGNQIDLFAQSLLARHLQIQGKEAEIHQEGYQGEYLKEFAKKLPKKKAFSAQQIGQLGVKAMVASQKESLKNFGVVFNKWFLQSELLKKKEIEKSLSRLQKTGHLYESEGAIFFRSTTFGDDKDRVVRKQDGEYSYFASDIAYHNDKFARKFNWVIDILGPDHHGYVSRTKAALQALGYDSNQLTVLISQQVNLLQNEVLVKMSKRAGKLITMDDLMKEVGKDVARYFFLMRSTSSHLDFDLELAKKETPENPVFYIQYAHARIASIFRKALQTKIKADFKKVALELLNLPEEGEIAKHLLEFPNVLAKTAKELEPHHLAFYVLELAKQFQSYYSQAKHDPRYKVVDLGNFETTNAKLYLLKNIQIVLQNALGILGVSAPQRMKKEDAASTL